MKKIAVVLAMALAVFAVSELYANQSNVGCGVGSMIFQGRGGLVSQTLRSPPTTFCSTSLSASRRARSTAAGSAALFPMSGSTVSSRKISTASQQT